MITRLERKKRQPELGQVTDKISPMEVFDSVMMEVFRLNSYEYNYLADNTTDVEHMLIVNPPKTFEQKRKLLTMIQRHLAEYKSTVLLK